MMATTASATSLYWDKKSVIRVVLSPN